jgi:hypothetical protein
LILCSALRAVTGEELWLWEGYLARGCVTIFSALFKVGKTTLLAHLLLSLWQGGVFLGRRVVAGKALYVAEEAEGKWAERRDHLGLQDNLTFVIRPFRKGRATWRGWEQFVAWLGEVQARGRYDLIVFDTISDLWPVTDENSAAEVRRALKPLHAAIGEAALLLVHHLRKSDGQEGTGARGSGDVGAFVDIILELRRYDPADLKNPRRELTGMARYDETPAKLVVRLGEAGYAVEGADRAEVRARDLFGALARTLPGGPPGMTVPQIVEGFDGDAPPDRGALHKALAAGCEEGRWVRAGSGRRGSPYTYWRPAPGPEAPPENPFDRDE